ncbi:uncharacterized protein LOC120524964 [Polypterus senegalus]|uniref:uncharacterized protein LOC120524964 n=1 Tax=Polypterus senegalus TaxID=55291 RepID=UPI0019661EE8|nr:uncharacterized protein LOC120524964 [Polypterus senegalus]XP_039602819.1 uncharacterized protein LOC120524964 [Polypterus senegalus]XP_039602820.1 uncharacterized protein LOC120524964 [Polypterus senegalus]XP_039602821.1 uncharacterized protein LOC120524964 [Polypterus senegalus]
MLRTIMKAMKRCGIVSIKLFMWITVYSLPCIESAKQLVNKLCQHLSEGGFEIRQWASNFTSVILHLPDEARSENSLLWLSQHGEEPLEPTLGLRWNCAMDSLGYRCCPIECIEPTKRNIYKVLASQYDPLGFLTPFTARAKVLVQDLWKTESGWDDHITPDTLVQRWLTWVEELDSIKHVILPRCYIPPCANTPGAKRDLHVFCDTSKRLYGSVAYLRTEDEKGGIHVSFVMARSRVAPKRQISMPRLELCAALTCAQLAHLLTTELTLPIGQVLLWSDSTTILTWLKSESCRYKVFVGTRVAEIQNLTNLDNWNYIATKDNPADDITRGKTLKELSELNRWRN